MLSEQEEKEKLEAEAKAKTEAEAAEKAKWDEQQQKADQEAANAKKAREQVETVTSELETSKAEVETLKEQLEAAEAKAAQAGIKDVDLNEEDYQGTDLTIVKAIKSINEKLAAKDKQLDTLEKKATGYERQAREDEAVVERNSIYEELLSGLDEEYGADCRNEALKRFSELTAAGEVPTRNTAKATRIMERCYKEAKAAKAEAKDKSSLSLDSGSGGGNAPNLAGVEIKKGSLDDVAEQYGKALGNRKS